MKNTKTRILTVLMALVMSFCLAACGDKNNDADVTDLTGTTWALSGGSQGGTTVDKPTLESVLGGEMAYTFAEEGKVTLSLNENSVEGTWTQDGNSVSLDIQGQTGTMTLDGDKLVLEQGDVTVEFSKK